jgi:flagellar hook-basal body complex protein FliE
MVVFGIYGSGLSLSQDIILRKRIKSFARGDQSFLSSIGTAQMENQVARVVGNLKSIIDNEEAELKQHSGLDTVMEKDEIKDYLEQVMVEVQKSRRIQGT